MTATGPNPNLFHRMLYAPSGAPEFRQPEIDMGVHRWEPPGYFIGNLSDWCACGHGKTHHGPGCTFSLGAFVCDCPGFNAPMHTPCGAVWMPGWDYRNNKRAY